MSFPAPCPGCANGDHTRHDPDHGTIPGLIGGTTCHCPGDCAERVAAEREAFLATWAPDMQDRVDALRSQGIAVWDTSNRNRHPGHPWWSNPPYPELAPTRVSRVLIRVTEWLRRLNGRPT